MKRLITALLILVCGLAQAQVAQMKPFQPTGNTITFTANISGNIPSPVQAKTSAGFDTQYLITNVGANVAFISYAGSSADATSNCVVPTGTATTVVPVLNLSQEIITTFANSWFCGITSASTSIIYITPGVGQ